MTENRRFYYLKLKENFYNSETMVILESMQDGLLYSNLLLKMYLMSLKSSGVLLLNDYLPHTVQTIATFTRHQVGTVERALKIFQEFGLVEILTDGAYYMSDIQLLRPVFQRGGAEEKGAHETETPEPAPVWGNGHLSVQWPGGQMSAYIRV